MFDFQNKAAVVTGAGGAIGGRVAHGLSRSGARVAIWDISKEAADVRAEEINALGGAEAIGVACDVTSKPEVDAALAATLGVSLDGV